MTINLRASAKVNLALHITGRREDGYHELDSIVVFADIGDHITIDAATNISLTIEGPQSAQLSTDEDNLVARAARALTDWAIKNSRSIEGAHIRLGKHLPIASGIGGGSADAAATLQGLRRLWQLVIDDQSLAEIALTLGADVPMCLDDKPKRAHGIGDILTPLSMPPFHMVLVNPGISVSTPEVFGNLKKSENPPLSKQPLTLDRPDWIDWLAEQRNDLQLPAQTRVPEIASVLSHIDQSGAALTRMSGSGATCFGLYTNQDQANKAAQLILKHQPDWWVAACRTTSIT